MAGLLVAVLLFSGCAGGEKLPPTFRIDKVQHWFEGDKLILNVTFTNVANFTTEGLGFLSYISVALHEHQILTHDGEPGEETREMVDAGKSIRLYLVAKSEAPQVKRWDGKAPARAPPLTPGQTMQVEFEFTPKYQWVAKEGYYYFYIDAPSFYPNAEIGDYLIFTTGCFNRDTPEFYGVKPNGADCFIWDCYGEWTTNWWNSNHRYPSYYSAPCRATNATGQFY